MHGVGSGDRGGTVSRPATTRLQVHHGERWRGEKDWKGGKVEGVGRVGGIVREC